MKKKLMPTAIAFAILMLLGIYANFFETDEITPPGAQKPEFILKCNAEDITAMAWQPASGRNFKIKIAKDEASIVEPASYAADFKQVEALTRHFAELRAEMTVAPDQSQAEKYGFNQNSPAVVIEAKGVATRLKLGNKIEVGGSYYLIKEGDQRIFSVPAYIRAGFYKSLDDLRDNRLFHADFGRVTSIELLHSGEKIVLQLDQEKNEWNITSPEAFATDGVAVASLIQRVKDMRISRFLYEENAEETDFGLSEPALSILLKNDQQQTWKFLQGKKAGTESYISAGAKEVFASLNSDLQELWLGVGDLREKYISTPFIADLKEIIVSDATGSITIENRDGNWQVGIQKIAKADIRNFVSSIGKARVFAFLEEEHKSILGLANPDENRRINLKTADSGLIIELGSIEGPNVGAIVNGEVMEVNVELEQAFQKLMYQLRRHFYEEKKISD